LSVDCIAVGSRAQLHDLLVVRSVFERLRLRFYCGNSVKRTWLSCLRLAIVSVVVQSSSRIHGPWKLSILRAKVEDRNMSTAWMFVLVHLIQRILTIAQKSS